MSSDSLKILNKGNHLPDGPFNAYKDSPRHDAVAYAVFFYLWKHFEPLYVDVIEAVAGADAEF